MSKYTEAVENNLAGLEAVSTGPCPGCEECASNRGYCCAHSFAAAYEAGEVEPEPSFSWSSCDICGSHLGGDREEWHAIVPNKDGTLKGGEIFHGNNACVDCVVYLANGEEPERWKP